MEDAPMNPTTRTSVGARIVGLAICGWVLTSAVSFAQMMYGSIVINPVGHTYEICQLWSAAAGPVLDACRKTLRVASEAVIEKDTYNTLYQDFVDGGPGTNADALNGQPRWNAALGSDLIKSELALHWKMALFLESSGARGVAVDSLKQTLFSEQLSFEAGNRSERLFNQLAQQRLNILKLR
jgi:hypothetical protein